MSRRRVRSAPQQVSSSLASPGASPPGQVSLESVFAWGIYPIALLTVIVFLTVRPIADPDCWFHMAHGRHFLEHGEVLKKDIFSHTAAGREWISSGWASSVLMQMLFSRWGPDGIIFLVTGAVALVTGLFYVEAVRARVLPELAVLVACASLLAGSMRFNPRPDLASIVCVSVLAWALVRLDGMGPMGRRAKLGAAMIPALIIVWANLHAGFLAGIIILWIAAVWPELIRTRGTERIRRWWLVCAAAASSLVWLFNPYGWRIIELAAKIRAIPGVRMLIFEWMPLVFLPGFNMPWPVYLGILALVAIALATWWHGHGSRKHWTWAAALFLGAFALWQRRQVGLFAAALPFLMMPWLALLSNKLLSYRKLLAGGALGGCLAICALQYHGALELGQGGPTTGVNARMLPCIATEYLSQTEVPPRLFNSYGMGGYLLYHLGTRLPVFIDGRLDVYEPRVWADYLAVEEDKLSIDEARKRYSVNTFAIETREAFGDPVHLVNRLSGHPAWALIFFDDDYAIFVHRQAANQELLAEEFRFANPFQPARLLNALAQPSQRQRALEELQRAVQLSNGSAMAFGLAALGAAHNGEHDAALRFRALAAQRDPACPLLTWTPSTPQR